MSDRLFSVIDAIWVSRHIYELWGEGEDYEKVHAEVKKTSDRWDDYMTCSFKFVVSCFGSTIVAKEQLAIINSFSYLGFEGVIDMKNPDEQFHVLADYGAENGTQRSAPLYIYMGRLVCWNISCIVSIYSKFLILGCYWKS